MTVHRILAFLFLAAMTAALLHAETPRPDPPKPVDPALPTAAPKPPSPAKRVVAGPGDYALRERILHRLAQDPDLSKGPPTLVMVNGGAVFSGEMKTCELKMRALKLAASVRGVINVTDEMHVSRADLPDAALHRAVAEVLKGAGEQLGLRDLEVVVEDTVATLSGTVRDYNSRVKAEEVAGTVLGVTRVVNRLHPADAPAGTDDASLANALVKYLSDFHQLRFPADIEVHVDRGVVTLTGRATHFMGRQQAGVLASLVGGSAKVENQIKVDPALAPMTGTKVSVR
jgi:osmotically-inducible protein OsmY